ncbi:protein adenylyltransferase SelO [Chitinibacteraceae bacterium HSL-7]
MTTTPRFALLGKPLITECRASMLPEPELALFNDALAAELGLDAALRDAALLSGNAEFPSYPQRASVYSGHQFGVWAGQLGDGRALLVAELDTPAGIHEIQLKGAGKTPYSRMGDGRAVLRSSIREYLASEAMAALGIPTTRALALVSSPLPVWREEVETAAVVTRVAPSFVRFGHFEHFFYRGETETLTQLLDFCISHFYPECEAAPNRYLALLDAVITRTATLMAQWQAVGFCHGVMNTDNMSLLGLTLDYGPYGFLDGFNARHICNHSDSSGRYAYDQQPAIALWNLSCLAQTLVNHVERDALIAALHTFQPQYEAAFGAQLAGKLGFCDWHDNDWALVEDLFQQMQASRTDWTHFWRTLATTPVSLRDHFTDRDAFDGWLARYQTRLSSEGRPDTERVAAMLRVNPRYVLRNHLAELAIRAAQKGDFAPTRELAQVLSTPFDEQAGFEHYAALPPDWASDLEVSCSS